METDSITHIYDYAHVAAADQNEDRQIVALQAADERREAQICDNGIYGILPKF